MMLILLAWIEFVFGSFMFSCWLGRMAKVDVRKVGDGNPGAFNLWSAAGYRLGLTGVALDFLKGYFPLVWIAGQGLEAGYHLTLLAAAPLLGHIFSPFLKFRGGKGIAVTFGIWSALTGFEASLVYAILLACMLGISKLLSRGERGSRISDEASGLHVVLGMLLLLLYLYVRGFSGPFLLLGLINLILLVFTNRSKLSILLRRGRVMKNG
ncbi:glycerol-3-phosphate acyltransferase [Paenibacillus pinistramenti]|uniref:glycerol-3-phosphate acyltransferase n=1 Tax=Paenibacillus pinistramenti TaxID=1768003 RepID=UPI001EF08DD7|nr:glycerol-3-phosphate acyltransferase [Paenibacillus pinistramenti]